MIGITVGTEQAHTYTENTWQCNVHKKNIVMTTCQWILRVPPLTGENIRQWNLKGRTLPVWIVHNGFAGKYKWGRRAAMLFSFLRNRVGSLQGSIILARSGEFQDHRGVASIRRNRDEEYISMHYTEAKATMTNLPTYSLETGNRCGRIQIGTQHDLFGRCDIICGK